MKTQTLIMNNYAEKRIAKTIIWAIGFFVVLYGIFVAMATFNVVRRISFEQKTRQLASEINNLELTYLQQSNSVDMSYAASVGFHDIASTAFAAPSNVAYNTSDAKAR